VKRAVIRRSSVYGRASRWFYRLPTLSLTPVVAEPSGPGAFGPQPRRKERAIDSVVVTLALLIVLLVLVNRITS
jgi:hypothetical protein